MEAKKEQDRLGMDCFLPSGKLPIDLLERFIKKYTSTQNGVVVSSKIGEDATVIEFGEGYLLAKTDPITFIAEELGIYTININANDIATMGGRPRWFLATILLPEKKTTQESAEKIFQQLSSACKDLGIAFCGGHTEITPGIDRPIVIGQMLGEVEKNRLITSDGVRVGDDIILTKGIAIEATSIIAREKGDHLKGRYNEVFIDKCKNFIFDPGISVLKDAEIALALGEVHSMHDPTEGGLATGLYELAMAGEVGMVIEENSISILPECMRLCKDFDIDPLGAIASGALIITLSPKDTERVHKGLREKGISSATIGKIIPKEGGMKLKGERGERKLPLFKRDEITKIME